MMTTMTAKTETRKLVAILQLIGEQRHTALVYTILVSKSNQLNNSKQNYEWY